MGEKEILKVLLSDASDYEVHNLIADFCGNYFYTVNDKSCDGCIFHNTDSGCGAKLTQHNTTQLRNKYISIMRDKKINKILNNQK